MEPCVPSRDVWLQMHTLSGSLFRSGWHSHCALIWEPPSYVAATSNQSKTRRELVLLRDKQVHHLFMSVFPLPACSHGCSLAALASRTSRDSY